MNSLHAYFNHFELKLLHESRTNCIPKFELKILQLLNQDHLIFVFTNLQNFSTGAKTGEYGWRKSTWSSSFLIISLVLLEEWYRALSSTIMTLNSYWNVNKLERKLTLIKRSY